ncbi:MAG: eCIS core domain-containing protein, partial [Pseudonocardiaceae bacterium]
MEPRFGHDLSHIRIHTDRKAAESARAVKARAYTVGNDVVFGEGEGEYSPRTLAGQRLLAHELVHTLQQSMSASVVQRQASLDIALRSPTVTAQVLGSEMLDSFELNSHVLTAEHKRRLLALATRLKELLREHQLGTVEITGHADATGDEALNDQLGQDRADAVAAFLRRAGVPAVALLAESAGESALRVPTDNPEPRNRRVEIRFLPELPIPSPSTPQPGAAKPPEKSVQIPLPENLCAEHPEICDPTTTKPEVMPSCSPTNCSAVSGDSFDKQPPDLQLVLTKSFKTNAAAWFKQLEPERRMALTQIFNRMCQYGVWCHVRLVLRIDAGEKPLKLAGHSFPVFGSTPSVFFTSPSGNALLEA